jgi:Protein of unknown function (DUF3309)
MLIIPLIVLFVLAIGGLPTWGYNRDWGYGYYPHGIVSLILIILIVLLLVGRI